MALSRPHRHCLVLALSLVMPVILASPARARESIVTEGLLLNYDFTAGSLPDAAGTVKDLSRNGINGVIRPTGPLSEDVYNRVAAKGTDYDTVIRSGGSLDNLTALVFKGAAWIHVPLDDRLVSLDEDGTIEFFVRPDRKSAWPTLLRCGSIRGDMPYVAFRLGYDTAGDANPQALFSDQRDKETPPTYSVQVNGRNNPGPLDPAMHQIAFVMRDGKGRFYCDGKPFAKQTVSGDQKKGSFFAYVLKNMPNKGSVRFGIGAGPASGHVGSGLTGELAAVRIYRKALTPRELARNLAATTDKNTGAADAEPLAAVRAAPENEMPLELYGKKVGSKDIMRFDVSVDTKEIREAWIEMNVDDIDEPKEARITLNGRTPIKVEGAVLGEGSGHFGKLFVPVSALREGDNEFEFVFADDLAGSTGGYTILDASLVLVVPKSLVPEKEITHVTALVSERISPTGGLPIDLRKAQVGNAATLRFTLKDIADVKQAALEILAGDIDDREEIEIRVNGKGPIEVPAKLVGERTGHLGRVNVPTEFLRAGENEVMLVFADNKGGQSRGFVIDDAALVLFRKRERAPEFVTDGLVVNYDFTAGSFPDAEGVVKDLSDSGIDAQLRPRRMSTAEVLGGEALEEAHYRIVTRSGGLADRVSELALSGGAWLDIPLDDSLASIDRNGSIELIVRPLPQGGMPCLVSCGSIAGGELQRLAFYVGFDFRGGNPDQLIFSDMRAAATPVEYSLRVHKASTPEPGQSTLQQITYVLRDGKGTFYQDGMPYTMQEAQGKKPASLFAWCVAKAGDKGKLRLGIGAHLHPGGAGAPFLGGVSAVRIYSRPLSPDEMRANYHATVGAEAPTRDAIQLLADKTAWRRPRKWLPREERPITRRTRPMVTATTLDFFDTPMAKPRLWTDKMVEQLVRHVAKAGFDIFYLRMSNGRAYWPSKVLDMYELHTDDPRYAKGAAALHASCRNLDLLESFVRWTHHYKMKSIYWLPIFDDETTLVRNAPGSEGHKKYGEYPLQSRIIRDKPWLQWEHQDTYKEPENVRRTQGRMANGMRRYWGGNLCYAYPEARQARVDLCREIVERYNMDGMAFTIRSHSQYGGWIKHIDHYGFSEPIVSEYKKRHGVDIRTQPFDRDKWAKIRGEGLTQLLRDCHAYLASAGRELHMLVNPGPDSLVADFPYFHTIRPMFWGKLDTDWRTWIDEKIIDTVIFYGSSEEGYPSDWVTEVAKFRKAIAASGIPAYYFYRLQGARTPLSACKTDVAQIYNDDNLDGLIIYETDNIFSGGLDDPESYGGKLARYFKEVFAGAGPE